MPKKIFFIISEYKSYVTHNACLGHYCRFIVIINSHDNKKKQNYFSDDDMKCHDLSITK